MTECDAFKKWFDERGCRVLAFTAEEWAYVGWVGHKIHGKSLGSIEGEIIEQNETITDKSDAK